MQLKTNSSFNIRDLLKCENVGQILTKISSLELDAIIPL